MKREIERQAVRMLHGCDTERCLKNLLLEFKADIKIFEQLETVQFPFTYSNGKVMNKEEYDLLRLRLKIGFNMIKAKLHLLQIQQ